MLKIQGKAIHASPEKLKSQNSGPYISPQADWRLDVQKNSNLIVERFVYVHNFAREIEWVLQKVRTIGVLYWFDDFIKSWQYAML